MSEHAWVEEEVDGGHLGIGTFWKCSSCGASGGPVGFMTGKRTEQRWEPFFPGKHVDITRDCEETKRIVREYKATVDWREERTLGLRETAGWVVNELEKRSVRGCAWPDGRVSAAAPGGIRGSVPAFLVTPCADVPDRCDSPGWMVQIDGAPAMHVDSYNAIIDCVQAEYGSPRR